MYFWLAAETLRLSDQSSTAATSEAAAINHVPKQASNEGFEGIQHEVDDDALLDVETGFGNPFEDLFDQSADGLHVHSCG